MLTDYSKPSGDIAIEVDGWQAKQSTLLTQQRDTAANLRSFPKRERCLLCQHHLDTSPAYTHRDINYTCCAACGHLQTQAQIPSDYPQAFSGSGFEAIYPALADDEYLSRRDRIYAPKLDWIISRLTEAGKSAEHAMQAPWLELGCGAGYFLHAALDRGIHQIQGLDENTALVNIANTQCGGPIAATTQNIYHDLQQSRAEIINAFFVLEHLEDAHRFWDILSKKPAGTVFVFSVPVWGITTLFEGITNNFAARNLDSVVHTQLYTDQSINHALQMSDYKKVAEWVFGQDAQDLCTQLLQAISSRMDPRLCEQFIPRISALIDPLQTVIDHAHLSDARHIMAIKEPV